MEKQHYLMKVKNLCRTVVSAVLLAVVMSAGSRGVLADDDLVHVEGLDSVAETAARLQQILAVRGLTVFLQLDHGEAARRSGFELRDMQLLVFGKPEMGAALIQCAPTVGIDLPLRMLVWADQRGQVWLSYTNMETLADRHDMAVCKALTEKVSVLLASIAAEVAGP